MLVVAEHAGLDSGGCSGGAECPHINRNTAGVGGEGVGCVVEDEIELEVIDYLQPPRIILYNNGHISLIEVILQYQIIDHRIGHIETLQHCHPRIVGVITELFHRIGNILGSEIRSNAHNPTLYTYKNNRINIY